MSRLEDAALLGKRGWLFPCGADKAVPTLTSSLPVEAERIERYCEELGERRRRLRTLRIPYLFAIAPLKERVYDRFLPHGMAAGENRFARKARTLLRDRNDGEIIDFLPVLRAGRRAGRVFPRTDSAWNDRGAFFAYRKMMKEAGKCLIDLGEPLLPAEARFIGRDGFGGDLAQKPKLQFAEGRLKPLEQDDQLWEEELDVADVSALRSLRMPAPDHLEVTPGHAPRLYEIADAPELPRAVLVGDACCLALIPWLAEHFSRFVFLWSTEPPFEALELEMPDVVIHVVSERTLVNAP